MKLGRNGWLDERSVYCIEREKTISSLQFLSLVVLQGQFQHLAIGKAKYVIKTESQTFEKLLQRSKEKISNPTQTTIAS